MSIYTNSPNPSVRSRFSWNPEEAYFESEVATKEHFGETT